MEKHQPIYSSVSQTIAVERSLTRSNWKQILLRLVAGFKWTWTRNICIGCMVVLKGAITLGLCVNTVQTLLRQSRIVSVRLSENQNLITDLFTMHANWCLSFMFALTLAMELHACPCRRRYSSFSLTSLFLPVFCLSPTSPTATLPSELPPHHPFSFVG